MAAVQTSGKAISAGAAGALTTLIAAALAFGTGAVDVPPESEISGAVTTIIMAAATGTASAAAAWIKRNYPK